MSSQVSDRACNFRIPLIDFGKFLAASSAQEKQETATKIAEGFKEVRNSLLQSSDSLHSITKVGFIYLENHGIPEAQVISVYEKVYWCIGLSSSTSMLTFHPRARTFSSNHRS
jgi:hypothetical protein